MKTIYVLVKQTVKVELDETKFTPEFLEEFAAHFFDYECVEQHAEHIGQLAAREVYAFNRHRPTEFVEGYGEIGKFGITAEVINTELEHATDPGELW
jgi:hypothetical protein